MLKRNLILTFVLLELTVLQAQNTDPAIPVNNEVTIEILSPILQISKESQFLQVKILVQSSQPLQYLDLKFVDSDANWSIIAASLNGNPIWLVRSDTTVNTPEVLGWVFDKDNFTLRLLPVAWNVPYTLDLDVQIDWTDLKSMENLILDQVQTRVQVSDNLYSCAASGRGVQVDLQK